MHRLDYTLSFVKFLFLWKERNVGCVECRRNLNRTFVVNFSNFFNTKKNLLSSQNQIVSTLKTITGIHILFPRFKLIEFITQTVLNSTTTKKYHHWWPLVITFFFIYNSETSNFPHFRWESSIKIDSQRAHASMKHGKKEQCECENEKKNNKNSLNLEKKSCDAVQKKKEFISVCCIHNENF